MAGKADVNVRSVSDNFDLLSRGGRLSADIQAVVAADHARRMELFSHQHCHSFPASRCVSIARGREPRRASIPV